MSLVTEAEADFKGLGSGSPATDDTWTEHSGLPAPAHSSVVQCYRQLLFSYSQLPFRKIKKSNSKVHRFAKNDCKKSKLKRFR